MDNKRAFGGLIISGRGEYDGRAARERKKDK